MKNFHYPIDVVLDTDTYNEIDDQFALSYLLASQDKLHTVGITAAPFFNAKSTSPEDGMEKSYLEILNILTLAKREDLIPKVYRGSRNYLENETTPVKSDAATFLSELVNEYSPEKKLVIVAIGAITNVASAILLNPKGMRENATIVWLGGNAHHWQDTHEFNMMQDISAARVVFSSGVSLCQLPCFGVVQYFRTNEKALRDNMIGCNPLCDYLANYTISEYGRGKEDWSKCIWDVTAIGYLLTDENHPFMDIESTKKPLPTYDEHYDFSQDLGSMMYVPKIHNDALFADLFEKLRNVFK